MPGMINSGQKYQVTGQKNDGTSFTGNFKWDGGSDAKLWTSKGDISFWGVKKQADGTLTARSGSGRFGSWQGRLEDRPNDGDSDVLKIGTVNADGTLNLNVDLAKGMTLSGKLR